MSGCAYKIVGVVISGILLIVLVVNAFYFYRLKNGKSLGSFELVSMYAISIILSIIIALYFAFCIYIASKECGVDKKIKETAEKHYGYYKTGREANRKYIEE